MYNKNIFVYLPWRKKENLLKDSYKQSSAACDLKGGAGGCPPLSNPPQPMRHLGRHAKHADMTFHTIFKFPRLASLHL